MPPDWSIGEELVDREMRAEAVREVLRDDRGETSREAVGDLFRLLTRGEASRSVTAQLRENVAALHDLYSETDPDVWLLLTAPGRLDPVHLAAAVAALDDLALPKTKEGKTDETWRKAIEKHRDAALADRWEDFLAGGVAAALLEKKEKFGRHPIDAAVEDALSPLVDHARGVLVGRLVDKNAATQELLLRFDDAYDRLKRADRSYRFSDVLRLLVRLRFSEHGDLMYERLDAKLDHLLLDEFQDTSPMQWMVLERLAEELTATFDEKSFFCVGDVKQAIYGWRGGEAEIFDHVSDTLPNLQCLPLDVSFRSAPKVIEAVNTIFTDLKNNPALKEREEEAALWAAGFNAHSTARNEFRGFVRLRAAPAVDAEDDAEGVKQNAVTLMYAARCIADLWRQAPGLSIGVLVRRNEAVGRLMAELRRLRVPASEEGGNPLVDAPAVLAVLSLLTLADHPSDSAAAAHVARSPLGAVVGLTPNPEPTAFRDAVEAAAAAVRRSLVVAGYGPTLAGWTERLAPFCDERDLRRLVQLVELGFRFEPTAGLRPSLFVDYVESTKVQDPNPASVRVMTIHLSKGLQFDAVVLPELDAPIQGQTPAVLYRRDQAGGPVSMVSCYPNKDLRRLEKQLEKLHDDYERRQVRETLSVLYVAVTRAVYGLEMIVAPSKENEKTFPKTYAGVVRAALVGTERVPPSTMLWEDADPDGL
ncbi:MAG: UvrD-helicase domain-containing protein, partial [Planctomycetia bacterium]